MSTSVPFGLTGACRGPLCHSGFAYVCSICFACSSGRFDVHLSAPRVPCMLLVLFPNCGRYDCMRTVVSVNFGGCLGHSVADASGEYIAISIVEFCLHCGCGESRREFSIPDCAVLCCLYGVSPSMFARGKGAQKNGGMHV